MSVEDIGKTGIVMVSRVDKAVLLAMVALVAPLAPAFAVPTPDGRHAPAPRKKRVTIETASSESSFRSISLGSFTPSLVAPSRAAEVRPQAAERTFRFTPSGKTGDRKALTLGLTSRTVVADPSRAEALHPTQTAYNVGASVGWLGFSLTGGYSRVDSGYGPRRDGVDLGLSYRGRNWKTSLFAVSETPAHIAIDPLALDKRTSFELGGAYSLSPRLSLNAGARYQLITPLDPRLQPERDPSVFVGTAFTF